MKLARQKNHVIFALNSGGDNKDQTYGANSTEIKPSIDQILTEENKYTQHRDEDTLAEDSVTPTIKMHAENVSREFREAEHSYSKTNIEEEDDEEDPDEKEATKLLDRGTQLLEMKEFRYAIDEFSAALFLCPNHPILTFQICVGRVNAHNHSKRYEAAANDARLAIGVRPDISHGYSLLGRSLFYCKDYAGTIIALEEPLRLIQPHEDPSVYDKAYLKKAQEALAASASDNATVCTVATSFTSTTLKSTYTTSSKSIPKLKPPRFVSREKIVAKGLNVPPPMPSKWPSQTTSPTAFQLGKIRRALDLSRI